MIRSIRRMSWTAFFLLAVAAGAFAGEPTFRFRETLHDTPAGGERGKWMIRFSVPLEAGWFFPPSSLTVRWGDLPILIPTPYGFWDSRRARVNAMSAGAVIGSARLRLRRDVLHVRIRSHRLEAPRTPFARDHLGETDSLVSRLENASVSYKSNGWSFALATGGIAVERRDGGSRVRLTGRGIPAEESGPLVRVISRPDARHRRGRLVTQVLSAEPIVRTWCRVGRERATSPEPVRVENRTWSGRRWTLSTFDVGIDADPGAHLVRFGVTDAAGGAARASARTLIPPVVETLAISANCQMLEIHGDGRIRASGENLEGEIGDGTRREPRSPVVLHGPEDVRSVAACSEFSAAVDGRGRVWRWGYLPRTRQIGEGGWVTKTVGSTVPVTAPGFSHAVAVAGRDEHCLILTAHGGVWGWGANGEGALGDRLDEDLVRPIRIPDLPRIHAIGAGVDLSFAIDGKGGLWAWGATGLAGIGGTTRPMLVPGLPPIIAAEGGLDAAVALDREGRLWTWAIDDPGSTPEMVPDLPPIREVSAGFDHFVAVDESGRAWAWGDNEDGQLGDGTDEGSAVPVRVSDLDRIVTAGAGCFFSWAITETGALWVWGGYPRSAGPGYGSLVPVLAKRAGPSGHRPASFSTADLAPR